MGSRGRSSGVDQRQISLNTVLLMANVERIKNEADIIRASMDFSSGGGAVSTKMKQCFCCEEYSIPIGTEYEVCPICEWIDDKLQNSNPDSVEGRNSISLEEAKQRYFDRNNPNN